MKNLDSCPICDSRNVISMNEVGLAPRVIHEIMPGVEVYAAIISHYYKCINCNLIFQNPRLSDTELNKYYRQGYYRKMVNLSDEEIDRSERYRAKVDADIIKKNLEKITSHLDIGCSRGYLLEEIWAETKVGVDKNPAWEILQGIKVYKTLEEVPERTFDLVSALHLLEHVPDPLAYLKKMTKFVTENGRLVLEVPTWKSEGGPLRLAHIYHFDPPVLRKMCMDVGLKIEKEFFTPHFLLICKVL